MPPLLLGSFIISFSGVFVKLLQVEPTASAFHRVFFGGLALLLLALPRKARLRQWSGHAGVGLLTALAFAADLVCWHKSILLLGPGLATLLGNFQVLFLALISLVLFRERLGVRYWLSLALALAGVACITGIDVRAYSPDMRLGILFGLLTAFFYAWYILGLRRCLSTPGEHDPVTVQTVVSLTTAALLYPTALVEGVSLALPDARNWALTLGYALLCQVIGWLCISRGLPRVRAATAGLVILLQPAMAFVWDVLLFGRPFGPREVLGAALTLTGIYLGATARRPQPARP